MAALTTIFTPPASCASLWTFANTGVSTGSTRIHQFYSIGDPQTSICLPSGYGLGFGVYSPGFFCPEGYTTADVVIENTATTTALCCSSNFTYTENGCSSPYSTSTSVVSYDYISNIISSTTVGPGITHGIKLTLIHGPADPTPSGFTTSMPGSSSSSGAAGSETRSITNEPTALTTTGLSEGAKAGIGVGVAVAVVLILIGFLLVFRYRRNPSKDPSNKPPPNIAELHGKTALHELDATKTEGPAELVAEPLTGRRGGDASYQELPARVPQTPGHEGSQHQHQLHELDSRVMGDSKS